MSYSLTLIASVYEILERLFWVINNIPTRPLRFILPAHRKGVQDMTENGAIGQR